jgi:hypothetical protein
MTTILTTSSQKNAGAKKILAKDHFFPNGACNHDEVENEGFNNHRGKGKIPETVGGVGVGDEPKADQKNQELQRRKQPLNERPRRGVSPLLLIGCIQGPTD